MRQTSLQQFPNFRIGHQNGSDWQWNGLLKENKENENIDAALVCEDRLREYT